MTKHSSRLSLLGAFSRKAKLKTLRHVHAGTIKCCKSTGDVWILRVHLLAAFTQEWEMYGHDKRSRATYYFLGEGGSEEVQ
jgi:hypothetical protein